MTWGTRSRFNTHLIVLNSKNCQQLVCFPGMGQHNSCKIIFAIVGEVTYQSLGECGKYLHPRVSNMKKLFLILPLTIALCTGCASHYDITLSNGDVITALGRPHLDSARQRYVYKDAEGQVASIPAMRVKEVAPSSMREKSPFISQ